MQEFPNRNAMAKALFPAGAVGAELGVYCGDYSAVLLETVPARLHLVDKWRGDNFMAIDSAEALEIVLAKFRAEPRVTIHQLDTLAWLRQQPPASLDWAYVDSSHAEHHVYSELCQLFRVVKPGGIIAGHDYCAATPGVVQAVERFCGHHGQEILALTDEPEHDVVRERRWRPKRLAFNSFAIRVSK